ncbi:MAG: DUF1461 domain-containing protein [archaeon]
MKKISLLIILIPIILILTSFYFLTFNENFYKNYSNYNEDKINNILHFLNDKEQLNYFTEDEQTHLLDVKNKIEITKTILILSWLTLILIITFLIYKKRYKFLGSFLTQSSLLTLALVITLTLITFLNFEQAFIKFHELIFTNNLWRLQPNSELLSLFPTEFFIQFTKRILLTITLSSIALLGLGYYLKR